MKKTKGKKVQRDTQRCVRASRDTSSNKECGERARRQSKTRVAKRSVLVKKGRSVEMVEIIFRH